MRPSKREALLTAAERLFYEEGFHATGIDRVVTEAGVARMTLYNHFPSKEALIEAVLARRYRRYLEDLRAVVETADRGGAVMTLAARHCEWLEKVSNRGCIVIKAIGEFERHHPPIAALGRRLKHELLALVAQALERDGQGQGAALAERLLVVLEGADALVPVLGAGPVSTHTRALVSAVLHETRETTS
ncbi:MAG: TetR/AcrR family transcriptional regulator [Gammaproteobacteria bacterium]|nr:TetR/AcrR family transcriptional regulator [Gammaproteobacteria bacterium]NIR82538.1 TetR/AcrR family transcriptional regulator [Gammaproteobacteria bacterium]NIR88364.1 TetR/AcrR family transcriptional regulator [Gammaproteobacteria bacterium]NIU03676.1 TetR/AcrR family transcriptional regulator [Gammaproteobacteria bacterium]NIV52890.1 TetR family transcriptional regulator [Gammaproteobacteria bacterium]